ncbi:MAG: polysaccharide deacetylase family protein [Sporolactobacillus sp.]
MFTPAKTPGALSRVETAQKKVALTFDCAEGDQQLPLILKTLSIDHARATFFISGEWAAMYPGMTKKIAKKGHEIESLGMGDDNSRMSSDALQNDLLMANAKISKYAKTTPQMVRPVNGKINTQFLQTAAELNLQAVLWSIDPPSEQQLPYPSIVKIVLEQAGSGDVIHLCASDQNKQTYRIVMLIIRDMENRGYQFVTLKNLIADTESKTEQLQ